MHFTVLSLVLASAGFQTAADAPPPRATIDSTAPAPRNVQAVRLGAAGGVSVDGVLSDAAWQSAVPFTQFRQRDPDQGAVPTESTVVWVTYDDAALYVGARLYDREPAKIVARLGRRDQDTDSDGFVVFLDPYFDRRSGFYFGVNAAGTQYDGVMFNDDWDDNTWDGVWEAKVTIDSLGWNVEMRIPYSQLRFVQKDTYVWGINFRRDIARRNEYDYLVYTPRNQSGFVSRFAELTGLQNVVPPRRVELMPYSTARAEYTNPSAGNPFNDGSRYAPGFGLDFRMGLGSNLTVNGTVNPDFGQVEVDPAVVNLSDVETFFNEKRPFFIEGSTIFNFGQGGARNYWGFNWPGPDIFYTRRIGRAPQGGLPDADYTDRPGGTTILGAAKLTGKVAGSWNVGALQAITQREHATLDTNGVQFQREVEPASYYGVFRAQQEMRNGYRALGFMTTVANRFFDDGRLRDQVNSQAFMTGIDGWTFLDSARTWVVTGWAGVSNVRGNTTRITSLQQNSQHYFQRPDADHVSVDPTATSLTGYAARVHLNKQRGRSFSNSAIGIISPGFDVHDVGFMSRADVINAHVGGGYQWSTPGKIRRYAEVGGAVFGNWDFQGNSTWRGIFHFGFFQFLNYWGVNWNVAYNPQTVSNRRTRGGPLTLNPPGAQFGAGVSTDSRKTIWWGVWFGTYQARHDRNWYVSPEVRVRPAPNVSVSFSPSFSKSFDAAQYQGTFPDSFATATFGNRYVFANIHQTELVAGVRLNWTFAPTMSLQLYAQPLISAGRYDEFKELARPKSFDFNIFGRSGTSTFNPATGVADPDGAGPADTIPLGHPDFNFRSLRGNVVFRWEYLPGSTLFLVWTQARGGADGIGEFRFRESFREMWRLQPDNIFMIKVSYWWNP